MVGRRLGVCQVGGWGGGLRTGGVLVLVFFWFCYRSNQNTFYLFFSPAGSTLGASGSRRLFFACASASSSHACSIGFSAIMLLCDSVRLSNLQIVLCDSAPTPGNLRLARALPTSACVTPATTTNKVRLV